MPPLFTRMVLAKQLESLEEQKSKDTAFHLGEALRFDAMASFAKDEQASFGEIAYLETQARRHAILARS